MDPNYHISTACAKLFSKQIKKKTKKKNHYLASFNHLEDGVLDDTGMVLQMHVAQHVT